MVEYPESDPFCNGNQLEATVTHAVQLGVLCFSSDGKSRTYYDDLVVECADQGHFFQYWDQYGSTTSTLQFRYTCFETANFPIGSTVDQTRTIPSVAMTLDPEWLLAPFSECSQTAHSNAVAISHHAESRLAKSLDDDGTLWASPTTTASAIHRGRQRAQSTFPCSIQRPRRTRWW
jgi:hypothetical protein